MIKATSRTSAFLVGLLSLPLSAAELTVQVQGIASSVGQLRVALYDAEGFPHEAQALAVETRPAPGPVMSVSFPDLEPGRYAVIAYHDKDADGRMDRFLGMIPTEPYGLSNNPKLSGPPKFDQAAVKLGPGAQRIEIRLQD